MDDDLMITDRAKVRRLRKNAGLTVPALARRAGVSHMTVYRLERGEYQPREPTLAAIAAVLGVEATELETAA